MLLVRKEHGASQALTARRMRLSRDQLKRIERGEVAVRLVPALRFCEFTNRNPLWLALGEGENRFGFFWPKETAERTWVLLSIGDDWASDKAVVEGNAQDLTLLNVIHAHRERFSRATRFFATSDTDPRLSTGGFRPRRIGAVFGRNVKYALTSQPAFIVAGSMKPKEFSLWPSLREKILNVVQQRGMKSALARDMGVSRQAVNALLNKKRSDVPSAQYAWLSHWVEMAEAHQKPSSDNISRTRRKRQSRARKMRTDHKQRDLD